MARLRTSTAARMRRTLKLPVLSSTWNTSQNLLASRFGVWLGCDTVDGSEIQRLPPFGGCFGIPVNNGIYSKYQLVDAGFVPSTVLVVGWVA